MSSQNSILISSHLLTFWSSRIIAWSSQNYSPWSLFPHPDNRGEPQCLTRNCIKFQLLRGAPGSLTLIDAFSHFEVYVDARHNICVHSCPLIWHTLVQGIQKAAKNLKYQLVPKQAFLCKHKNTRTHLALPADAFNYWKCELHPDISGLLTNQHRVWKGNIGLIHVPTQPTHIYDFLLLTCRRWSTSG